MGSHMSHVISPWVRKKISPGIWDASQFAIRPVFGHVDPGTVLIILAVLVYERKNIPGDLVVDLHICMSHSVRISILPVIS